MKNRQRFVWSAGDLEEVVTSKRKHVSIEYQAIKSSITLLRWLGIKTFGYFGDTLDRLVKDLFNKHIDELEFVQVAEDLLYGQLRDAWMEGMAVNGLTEDDMTPEYETELGGLIQAQNEQLLDFADAIVEESNAPDASIDGLLARADLWNNAYLDVYNQAIAYTADAADKFEWVLGNTEHHCETCEALDGTIATAEDWLASGIRPQDPPNDQLECGGWRCDCKLVPTKDPVTEGGIPGA